MTEQLENKLEDIESELDWEEVDLLEWLRDNMDDADTLQEFLSNAQGEDIWEFWQEILEIWRENQNNDDVMEILSWIYNIIDEQMKLSEDLYDHLWEYRSHLRELLEGWEDPSDNEPTTNSWEDSWWDKTKEYEDGCEIEQPEYATHIVKSWDTLWHIVDEHYGLGGDSEKITDYINAVVWFNEWEPLDEKFFEEQWWEVYWNHIYPGQEIKLPDGEWVEDNCNPEDNEKKWSEIKSDFDFEITTQALWEEWW